MNLSYDILIASFNRSEVLERCLKSITKQRCNNSHQLYILLLKTDIESKEIIRKQNMSGIEVVEVDTLPTPGKSRNILSAKSTSQFVLFLDDDVELPIRYLEEAEKVLLANEFDIFGGADSEKTNLSFNQEVLANILASYFVMGPTARRHHTMSTKTRATELDLTLCNLWIRRSLLEKISFNEEVKRCEENILIDSLQTKEGASVGYISELVVKHLRRENVLDQIKIQFKSGYYRGVSFFLPNVVFKKMFIIPIFVGLILFISPLLEQSFLFVLFLIHFLLTLTLGIQTFFQTNNIIALPLTWLYTAVIHVFFSLGIFIGVLKGAKGKYFGK